MKDGLEAFVARLEAEADPRRIAAEVGKEVAAVAAAERGAVARALRAGAALRRLRAVSPDAHRAALRRIWGRSPRSASNYQRLHKAYQESPAMAAAILAAPSLRAALELLPPTRPGRAPAARSASSTPAPPFADADALLRACAGRGRELRALYEAAADLAGGASPGADPATEATALAAAVTAAFGTADPAVLRTMAARAAADMDEPVAEALDASRRSGAAAPAAIAGVLVGANAADAGGAVPVDAIADSLEEVAAALRTLALPGAEEAAAGGPVALVFEAYAGIPARRRRTS